VGDLGTFKLGTDADVTEDRAPQENNILPDAAKIVLCAASHGFRMSSADPDYQKMQYGRTVPWSSHLIGELSGALRASRVL
jgi:POT family proton-dependent oligopeptide transporter